MCNFVYLCYVCVWINDITQIRHAERDMKWHMKRQTLRDRHAERNEGAHEETDTQRET